jgi:hypothetical protein
MNTNPQLKKQAPAGEACFLDLQLYDIFCPQALIAVSNIEAHRVAIGQGLEPFAADGGVVSKNIGAVVPGDKAKTLGTSFIY